MVARRSTPLDAIGDVPPFNDDESGPLLWWAMPTLRLEKSAMCGICGMYHFGCSEPVDRELLPRMLAAIKHRGPDDQGIFDEEGLALGMRRLSIIDLGGGSQPMFNESGDVVVVFNGEIYNYVELRRRLLAHGHHLATDSDTEVIVHLYEDYGEDCVDHLRGMFAFALWDARRKRLLFARDRLGIKPLYYAEFDGRVVFGSEIKAMLLHPKLSARLDPHALSNYLSLKYVPAPQTIFAGIASLPPGHTMSVDRRGVSVRRYWDLSFVETHDRRMSEEDYADRLDEMLQESVKLRLRSDVPFGAFLSGGVDSSLVVALMSHQLDEPVKTYSVGFEGGDGEDKVDELPFARLTAKQFGTDHHEIVVLPGDFIELVQKVAWHLDQPLADQATIPAYWLSQLAARDVKMVLTGEGGDELFAGYSRYYGERFSSWFRCLPACARSLVLAAGAHVPRLRRAKIALYALCQADEAARLTNWFPLFNREMKASLLSDRLRGQLDGVSTEQVFHDHLVGLKASQPLNRMLYVDTKLWLPDYLLLRGDKMSMAASLEARVPLLDHKLVEFAAGLPTHLKLRGFRRKYLLKKVARRYLPIEVVKRRKRGFPMPLAAWFRADARPFVRDLLSPEVVRRRGLFDTRQVQRLLDEHDSRYADHAALLWGLVALELWQRHYLDAAPRASTTTKPVAAAYG